MIWSKRLGYLGLFLITLFTAIPSLAKTKPLVVMTTRIPLAPSDRPYSFQLYASGGTAPYTWTVSGLQATGLSATSAGVISGTPTQYGSYDLQLTVTDSLQNQASDTVTLIIYDGGLHGAISQRFFGLHILNTSDWPQLSAQVNAFGVIRLWDTGTAWAQIEKVEGSPRWNTLDSYTKLAQANGVSVLYELGMTPTWASSDPTDTSCRQPGSCDAPADWQTFIDFMTALVSRYTSTGVQTGCTQTNPQCNGTIRTYEVWNEPYVPDMWNPAQKIYDGDPKLTMLGFVTLTQIARNIIKTIDPNAIVSSPSINSTFLGPYWATPGAVRDFDRIAMHAYPLPSIPAPELMIHQTAQVVDLMKKYHVTSPLINTEGSWGHWQPKLPQDQIAYAARYILLEIAMGMKKSLWYTWSGLAPLWNTGVNPGNVTPGGGGYQQVASWLLGANMRSSGCLDKKGNFQGQIYSCTGWNGTYVVNLSRREGYRGQVVWFVKIITGGGVDWRATTTYKVPRGFTQYLDLNGVVHPISTRTITVGDSPILLQNQPILGPL
jgi:hypothetical protein